MAAPSFKEMTGNVVAAILTTWRPCQPLLLAAVVGSLVVTGVVGILAPGDVGQAFAGLPLMVLTLAVSAGVAGYIVSGDGAFTTLGGVMRHPLSYRFVLRYLLLSIALSVPVILMVPVLTSAAAGDGLGAPAAITALLLLSVLLFLAARLAVFPYGAFLDPPVSLQDAFLMTQGHALKIIGCVLIFAVGILAALGALTAVARLVVDGIAGATGLGGGAAAIMAMQSVGQIVAAYAIDCLYGTITRMLAAPSSQPPQLEADD
ncbi:MAG: hypothetical protein AAFX81_14765 [Pseudomonadota bacterium]